MAIIRHNRPIIQRLGNDIIYGPGDDGTTTISTNTLMVRDMYYGNLTINSGAVLFTNGFRVFCSGNLTVNGTLGMPEGIAATTPIGTVVGRVADGTPGVAKTYVLGDSDAGGAAQVPASILKDLESAIQGWNWDITDGFKRIEGGSDGTAGSGGAGGAGTPGSAGNPGGAAGGSVPLGNPGNPGNPGSTGAAGGAGTGGDGGVGGGLVVIIAKTITGSGTIISQGATGAAGTTGTPGESGGAGNPGTAGNPAPAPNSPVAGNPPYHTPAHNAPGVNLPGTGVNLPGVNLPGTYDPTTGTYDPVSDPPTTGVNLPSTKETPGPPVTNPAHNPGFFHAPNNYHVAGTEYFETHAGPPVFHNVPGNPYPIAGDFTAGQPYPIPGEPFAGEPFAGQPYPIAGEPFDGQEYFTGPFPGNPPTAGNMDPGGTAGTGGAGGSGGAGGTATTGDTGNYGGIIVVTDSSSPLSTTITSATYTHLQAST